MSRSSRPCDLDPRYPPSAIELAERIDNDGLNHFEKFSEIQVAFRAYAATGPSHPYLRDIKPGDADSAKEALDLYHEIVASLGAAYKDYAHNRYGEGAPHVAAARTKMKKLLDVGEALAAKGIGIPFWRRLTAKVVSRAAWTGGVRRARQSGRDARGPRGGSSASEARCQRSARASRKSADSKPSLKPR